MTQVASSDHINSDSNNGASAQVPDQQVPRHIAIIPDGNRRWAKLQGLQPWEGHEVGVGRFWEIAELASECGAQYITFWASSYDNLAKRSALEVSVLMKIMRREVADPNFLKRCLDKDARFRVLGEWREFVKDAKFEREVDALQEATAHCTTGNLTVLFAYDGQREMLSAIDQLMQERLQDQEGNNQFPEAAPTGADLHQALWTADLPNVDLVIRTGGEPHWSAGFMMWLTANSQFVFSETLWPDFDQQEFDAALTEYARREKRHGK